MGVEIGLGVMAQYLLEVFADVTRRTALVGRLDIPSI
jgi:hypothetical protein